MFSGYDQMRHEKAMELQARLQRMAAREGLIGRVRATAKKGRR